MSDAGEAFNDMERLRAVEDISLLKARYFRLMDTKKWVEWAEVFAPRVSMDMRGEAAAMASLGFTPPPEGDLVWNGPEAIRAAVESALTGVVTVHHGHMQEISVTSRTAARGIWAMQDVLRYGPAAHIAGFTGYGHYHETYVNHDGAWKIETIKLTRLLVVPIPRD